MANGGLGKKDDRFQQINRIILNNESFLLAAREDDYDSLAAASALALVLKSLGKKVCLYAPKPIKIDERNSLYGMEEFKQELSLDGNKLLIKLNYPLDEVERVTSDDQGKNLTLVVELRPGKRADPEKVAVVSAGPEFQAGFVFDSLLDREEEWFRQGHWVWISRRGINKAWAEVSFVDKKATLSELTTSFITHGGFNLTPKAAVNLYLGIKKGTREFQEADSIALETAAYCLRIKEKEEKQLAQPEGAPREKTAPQTPLEAVEKKESPPVGGPEGGQSAPGAWQKPPIFTGATTPKV